MSYPLSNYSEITTLFRTKIEFKFGVPEYDRPLAEARRMISIQENIFLAGCSLNNCLID